MPVPLWTKFAAIALVAGSALAWGTAPTVAQTFPIRAAVIDSPSQVVQVGGHRAIDRDRRRWRRDDRRFRRDYHYGHRGPVIHFGIGAPYVVAPPPVYVAPPVTYAPAVVPCGSAVSVRPGDTLAAIAARCGTTVGHLLHANPHIYNPHAIFVGQIIRMPWG